MSAARGACTAGVRGPAGPAGDEHLAGAAGWRGLAGFPGRRVAAAVAAAESPPHGMCAAASKEEYPTHV